jgi:hypothetical protein
MRRPLKLISCILLLGTLPSLGWAQYSIDVKTKMEEKRELTVVKQGLISVLEKEPWVSETEVGEDYSLWLSGLDRTHEGDSLRVSVVASLRTPAMLSRGSEIDSYRVWIKYHWKRAQAYAKDSMDTSSIVESQNYEQLGSEMGKMAGLFATFAGGVPGAGELGSQLSGPMLGSFFSEAVAVLESDPSAVEVMEGVLVGRQVSTFTQKMIEENQ